MILENESKKTALKQGDIIYFDTEASLASISRHGRRILFENNNDKIYVGHHAPIDFRTARNIADFVAQTHGFRAQCTKQTETVFLFTVCV